MEFNTTMIQSLGFIPGTMVKNYRIVQEISRGGMGVVYLALDLKTQKKVAIKIILHYNFINDDRASKRFLRESEVLSTLEHPNIVHRYAMGIHGNIPYIVMQYVEGIPITEYARPMNKNNWKLYAQLMYKLANALAYIHSNGIIHRDLKANNILVQANSEPVILDFGLAKILNSKSFNLTHDGEILGSLNMSPEQAEGENSKIDERSDIYSLGTIFYEMLTGIPLVKNGSVSEVLKQIIKDKPIAPHRLNKRVPIELEKICLKCLAKSPNKRFQHASILEKHLKNYLESKSSNIKSSNFSLESFIKNKILIISACILLAIVIFFSIFSLNSNTIKDAKTQQAMQKSKPMQEKNDTPKQDNVQNDAEEQYQHGLKYYQAHNFAKAHEYYEKAAIQGHAPAQFNLGGMYLEGDGVKQDYAKALYWYEKAANQGEAVAQNNLGLMYANGKGVTQDFAKALYWWEKAANQGDASAQNNLALMYLEGQGVKQDYSKALYWLEKSAEQGFAPAQQVLPKLKSMQGKNDTPKQDNIQNNAKEQYKQGLEYYKKQDFAKACEWWEKAANQGEAVAQNNLGLMYANGKGVTQDFDKAVYWLEKASNQGNADAQNYLGLIYCNKKSVKQDYDKAEYWLEKSANQGYAQAQSYLGIIYYNGNGVKQDLKKAEYWLTRASNQGDEKAQQLLQQVKLKQKE